MTLLITLGCHSSVVVNALSCQPKGTGYDYPTSEFLLDQRGTGVVDPASRNGYQKLSRKVKTVKWVPGAFQESKVS